MVNEDNVDDVPFFPADLFFNVWQSFITFVDNCVEYIDEITIHQPILSTITRRECQAWICVGGFNGNVRGFWYLTGETPDSFSELIQDVSNLLANVRFNYGRSWYKQILCKEDQVLVTLIWLRQYPNVFHCTAQYIQESVYSVLLVMHETLYQREVYWHSAQHWLLLRNSFENFSTIVAWKDCTPKRINTFQGRLQRLYYRGDCAYHFIKG